MAFQWNPWHGCHKYSEGCKNCYMHVLDEARGINPTIVKKSPTMFDYPVQRCKNGTYKYKGHYLRTCFTSDFFVEEADQWREEVWSMIKERSDVKFLIYTKRIERVREYLPSDWGDGYSNVLLTVTAENQRRADERIPQFLEIPCKWRAIAVSPMLEHMNLEKYLSTGEIDEVMVCGEAYSDYACILDYSWVTDLRQQCIDNKVSFVFSETGNFLRMNGTVYRIPNDKTWEQAEKAGLNKKFSRKDRLKLRKERELNFKQIDLMADYNF
jgi:protein gp37